MKQLFLGENVFFLLKNAFLSQHRHVLICDFESAYTSTRQETDNWNETLFLGENAFLSQHSMC